jgi:hypothetical protein
MPLGPGIKTDIRTGEPILENPQTKKEEAQARFVEAVQRSLAFQADLAGPGGLVVEALVEQMITYAGETLSQDPVYKSFLAVLQRLNLEINLAPRVVERHLRKILPSYERPAAPGGIPADDQ